jgi:hypothetical protein
MDSFRRFHHVNVVTSALFTVAALGCSSASGPSETEDATAGGTSAREGTGGKGGLSSGGGLAGIGGVRDSSQEDAKGATGGTTGGTEWSSSNRGGTANGTSEPLGGAGGATGGTSGSTAPGTDALGSYANFCSTVASTVCAAISSCCSMTRSECEVGYQRLCLRQWDLAAGATYSPERAKACLPLLAGMFDGCEYQPAESQAYRDAERACEPVVVGSVPTGGVCANDRYCAADTSHASVCSPASTGISTCKAIAWIAIGAPCGEAIEGRCASDAFCDAVSHVCSPLRLTDEACDSPMQCLSYHCDAGTCKPATTAGICSNIST